MGGQKQEHVAQSGCGICILGDNKSLTGHGSEQPTVADSAWAGGGELDDLKRFLLTQAILCFCDYM